METAVLNVKISSELKEQVRSYAELHGETLGAVTEQFLRMAFESLDAGVKEDDIDNQHTEEEGVQPLNAKEIKALRKLLKKRK
ncbi:MULTISPECIES: hypothetical protein [Mangrovibacter]|uniref:Uncharacterized protein n=1 Tax=Mangrovibacter plantisponsor TaxID=451513 RepID=A0A317Q1I0_9ENTR|nr:MULTISPECIES: hypothetical protein [Mangrovibacter]KEA52182.1 hypothetical protein DT73_14895 [Mangrovibacter sp. MFB070]PWW08229.1 hypothetical protein DES37_107276 [Mangrovibacter plantisponsor]